MAAGLGERDRGVKSVGSTVGGDNWRAELDGHIGSCVGVLSFLENDEGGGGNKA